jgi:hypothetical protein
MKLNIHIDKIEINLMSKLQFVEFRLANLLR